MVESIDFSRHSLINATASVKRGTEPNEVFIRIEQPVFERDTGQELYIHTSVRLFLPEQIDVVVSRIIDGVVELLAHEVREGLHYRGRRIFDPHKAVK